MSRRRQPCECRLGEDAIERAGKLGLRTVIDELRALETRYGERFRLSRTLWDIASI